VDVPARGSSGLRWFFRGATEGGAYFGNLVWYFPYNGVASSRPKLSEHAESLILVSLEPCPLVGLGSIPPAEAREIRLDGAASSL
jgi:hypothetical protein